MESDDSTNSLGLKLISDIVYLYTWDILESIQRELFMQMGFAYMTEIKVGDLYNGLRNFIYTKLGVGSQSAALISMVRRRRL